MIRYPLPPQLTHDVFHSLVTDIYYQLTKRGIDPVWSMIIGDRDELLEDGTTYTHFSLMLSDEAADILKQSTTGSSP